MGRPEKTITTGVRELAALAEHLRRLRGASGKTYPELELAGGYSASVFSRAASGDALPTWQVAHAYGTACGADESALLAAWEAARDALDRQRSAGNADDAPAGPTDFNLRLRELIRRRGTQRSVAARANYSPSTVSAALNATRVPAAEFVDRILAGLDLPADDHARWQAWRAALATPDPPIPAPLAAVAAESSGALAAAETGGAPPAAEASSVPTAAEAGGIPTAAEAGRAPTAARAGAAVMAAAASVPATPGHSVADPRIPAARAAGSRTPALPSALVVLGPIVLAALLLAALFTLIPAAIDWWTAAC